MKFKLDQIFDSSHPVTLKNHLYSKPNTKSFKFCDTWTKTCKMRDVWNIINMYCFYTKNIIINI